MVGMLQMMMRPIRTMCRGNRDSCRNMPTQMVSYHGLVAAACAARWGFGCHQRVSSWNWKRRMLMIITGMTASRSTTASAAPTPKSRAGPNDSWKNRVATTCVSKRPLVVT